ncbi:restriction endonuclease subunit M [Caviibacterium pharyngocola]|uniref:site-specific DNA-methyltransferase (adenine-specific) n=1 Tax=Caviibacterium pharyngocola TaxID=28159 RepID=A0A2M8RX26_9PAST|nr:restriction endonuclease subunit M [Caviibacterium pharyngocola]
MLYWANKDQYYTKSGENFSNYAFHLPNGKKVQFRLIEADIAKDNRKDNDKIRLFVLAEPQIKIEVDENGDEIQRDILPIEELSDELIIRFEYKAVKKGEKQPTYTDQAVASLQKFAFQNQDFLQLFDLMPTDNDKSRTLVKKYLQDYTTKNTADYFIHKNLGKFLNQELDFYIKNEVMNLDDIQQETAFSTIEQNLNLIKTLKTIGQEIIAFLAQLEDFQKKLWLKKKFVAGSHYLITLDHLSEELIEQALQNPKQLEQWKALFNVDASGEIAEKLCKNQPHLVVDTSLFDTEFQAKVLREIDNLDEQTDGLLIHSDNFQALNLLQERYKEQVKCIYIDPPYNTDGDGFPYKDSYKHSSWISFMENRINIARKLHKEESLCFISIDENETKNLSFLAENIFSHEKSHVVDLIWNTQHSQQSGLFSVYHEYVQVYSNIPSNLFDNFDGGTGEIIAGAMKKISAANPASEFTFPTGVRFDGNEGQELTGIWGDTETLELVSGRFICENGKLKYPVTLKAGWTQKNQMHQFFYGKRPVFDTKGQEVIDFFFTATGKLKSIKLRSKITPKSLLPEFGTVSQSTEKLRHMFNAELFGRPKPVEMIKYLVGLPTKKINSPIILDYFAGSGTTAHAVINLNREDNGKRKYILVEQGEYFDSVLKPRVQKVVYSEKWKDGKPEKGDNGYNGVSQIVKVLKLESYEDTLNNLELRKPVQDLAELGLSESVQNDYLLHYMLDVESQGSLLNTQDFQKPFDYQLNIATSSAGAYQAQRIDLVETFNYLIGLCVEEVDDKREKGIVSVIGKLPNGEKAFILWRDMEKIGYDELNRYLDSRSIKAGDSEFDLIYINGDHNIPTVFADNDDVVKTLKVRSIENEFLERMFE